MSYRYVQGEGHMTSSDDSFAESSDLNSVDPLTSPAWMFEEDNDVLLAPPIEEFFSDIPNPRGTGAVVPPPNVDDIISGEYTGWVPIIKAGESLAEAQSRVVEIQQDVEEISQTYETKFGEAHRSATGESQADDTSAQNLTTDYFTGPIVADPDDVVSPAQALAEARQRIAAMRASLQVNLNKVASSFDHPIFTPSESEISVDSPTAINSEMPIENAASTSTEENRVSDESTDDSISNDESFESNRIFITPETIVQAEPQSNVASHDHSLELMIMRDEIKDLRDRLDASQKLIEDLMHRLANLAELAIKRQI